MVAPLLRPASPRDDGFLRRLYGTTRAAEMASVDWSQEQIDDFIDLQWRAQARDYHARFPTAEHSIVLVGGVPVGRIWVHRGVDEIRLLDLALLPEHQGTGIGGGLLRSLQAEAAATRLPLRHSVHKDNIRALALYQRLGFAVTSEIATHYGMEWVRRAENG